MSQFGRSGLVAYLLLTLSVGSTRAASTDAP